MYKSTKKESKETKSTEPTEQVKSVSDIIADYKSSWDYASGSYFESWESSWKLYNNIRVDESYEGISNTFVPMTFSTIETMVAAIAGGKPEFQFVPTTGVQEQDTEPLNSLLSYYWDCDKWSLRTITWIRNTLMYGTGVIYVYWDINKPRIINIPLRDFIIDPEATDISNARYVGRRYITTKNALSEMQKVDPKTKEMVPMYTNLEKLTGINEPNDDDTDKQRKDMMMGSTLNEEALGEQIEVIEYWDQVGDRVYSVANRSTMIRNDENPYKTQAKNLNHDYPEGLVPFVAQRDYMDESLFYGKGEIEPIKKEQELLNDITNQTSDSITYALNQMFTLDPRYADWIEKVENLPGAVYPFEAGALQPIVKGTIPNAAFEQISLIKQEIRETTAASEVAKGTDQSVSNVTATQINAQQKAAGQRFNIKLQQFEEEGFHELGKIIFEMMRLFITKPIEVRSVTDEGTKWIKFNPKNYTGDYEPRVMLGSTIRNNVEADQQKADAIFQTMVNNPLVDQTELTKMHLQKRFDIKPDQIAKLLVQKDTSGAGVPPGMETMGKLGAPGGPMGLPQDAMVGAPMGMPMDAPMGMPPGMPPMPPPGPEIKASDLVKLYDLASGQPDLQAEIIQQLGFTPSQFPDLPSTQIIVKETAADLDRALQIQAGNLTHDRAVAMNPNAPTPPGIPGVPMQPPAPLEVPPMAEPMTPPIMGTKNAKRK